MHYDQDAKDIDDRSDPAAADAIIQFRYQYSSVGTCLSVYLIVLYTHDKENDHDTTHEYIYKYI